jgi:multidrug transporter EmrE-like cation transporter
MKDPAIALGLAAMISCTVIANLLLKIGAGAPPDQRIFLGSLSLISLAGFVMFGLSGVIYALLLRTLPLNVAQSFTAAQFVAVIVASSWILAEPISPLRWMGIMLIIAGILVVAFTAGGGITDVTGLGQASTPLGFADKFRSK